MHIRFPYITWVEICNFLETKQSLKWISMYFVANISIYVPVHHPDKMFHPLFFSGENLCNVTKKNDETTLTKLSEYIWHGTRSNWFYSSGVRWCRAVVRDYLTPARQFRAHQNRGGWSLCSQSASWLFFSVGIRVCQHYWGRVHICVRKLAIIGSDNGLSPGRRQAIIWTNVGYSLLNSSEQTSVKF